MKLITKAIEQELKKKPLSYLDTPGSDFKTAICEFFHINGIEWYVLAGDKKGDDWMFFGYVKNHNCPHKSEYGCFTLKFLESLSDGYIGVERDETFFNQKIPFK